tara:strand:- start:651 stop:902 length:252 start_codon:yes stop_codon:yes gene_type:complete
MNKYLDNSSELEKQSKTDINFKPKEKELDVILRRQNIRIYILFLVLGLLIFMCLKEYVYDYVIIKKGGLNYFTLCQNIPNDCY